MTSRLLQTMGFLIVAAAVLWATVTSAGAQGGSSGPAKGAATAASRTWTPPRTPDGQPDISGMWVSDFYGRPLEAKKVNPNVDAKAAAALFDALGPPIEDVWNDTKRANDGVPAIVDPPDARIPWLPWAAKARDYVSQHQGEAGGPVDPLFLDPVAKCLPYGVPRSNTPSAYSGFQFLQRPGYVVIYYEQGHQFRVIPLDKRPHLNKKIKLWMGNSRGHWEGNTLVVDVTNLTDKTWAWGRATAAQISTPFHSDALHVVERFIFSSPDAIDYEATMEDPNVYAKPWKIAVRAFARAPKGHELFEYACIEGNKAKAGITGSAQK